LISNHPSPGRPAADRLLILALIIAALATLHGISWGRVESFNPDEMAFRNLFAHRFLEPEDFQKPPFHTYVNFFLSVVPFKAAELAGKAITGTPSSLSAQRLWWSRCLQIGFFLGMVYVLHRIVRRSGGVEGARIIAVLAATSAGFVLQTHFLTADVPVTFWMLASFLAAQRILVDPRLRSYLLAGLLVGIATATKYNGLAAGIAIPIFHLLGPGRRSVLRALLDRRLITGVAMVALAFVAANPYSILDYPRFAADFAYNYAVTPTYGGREGAHYGFAEFLETIPDVIGWPTALIAAAGSSYALARLRHAPLAERASVIASLGVFALYFLQFGRAPRIETRFVMACVPFLLIASAPLWSMAVGRRRTLAIAAVAAIVAYNALACFWVGARFAGDPRMAAQAWVAAHVPAHAAIESSQYTPHWNLLPGVAVDDVRMPAVSARAGILARVFKSDPSMLDEVTRREGDRGIEWYGADALARRRPLFVALDSKYFDRYLRDDVAAREYPLVHDFMASLLAGRLGYHVVFDATAGGSPAWLYPRDIDFVDSRIVILQRDGG
jgi:4-amino-4-deoxy-L-arabinose transferase-like glycosyltransferase